MGLLSDLRRALFGDPRPPEPASTPADALAWSSSDSAGPARRAEPAAEARERAAERLLEDERLRGNLTDDEFQPLLDWALAAVDGVAIQTSRASDDTAETRVDAAVAAVRQILVAIDRAIGERELLSRDEFAARLSEATDALAPPLVQNQALAAVRARVAEAVDRIADEKDELDGPALTARLAEALAASTEPAGGGSG